MDFNKFVEAIATYQSPNVECLADGTTDTEATAALMLESVGNFCQRIAPVDNLDALALVVCHYSRHATTPGECENAERAAEALAAIIEQSQLITDCAEPLERISAAARGLFSQK